jgi:hypothetical protein
MSLKPSKFIFLGGIALSLLFGNSAVAQIDSSNDPVVVPTTGSGGTTYPSGGGTVSTGTSTVDGNARFSCQFVNGQYTVMYQPESQPGQYFAWAAPQTLGGGWDTQKRCQTIAQRLESYRPDGLLELQTAVENRENIVCVTTEAKPYCRIVLTVPRGKDPYTVRNNVFQNLVSADSGQETIAVNTYRNGRNEVNDLYNLGRTLLGNGKKPAVSTSRTGINLKAFLDPKDGGTAKGLRNGVTIRRQNNTTGGTKLNPNNFRRR